MCNWNHSWLNRNLWSSTNFESKLIKTNWTVLKGCVLLCQTNSFVEMSSYISSPKKETACYKTLIFGSLAMCLCIIWSLAVSRWISYCRTIKWQNKLWRRQQTNMNISISYCSNTCSKWKPWNINQTMMCHSIYSLFVFFPVSKE